VCWSSKPPSPSGSDAGICPPGSTTAPCPTPPCPSVEIEINNTPAANDDLVALKCEHPARRTAVNCRIRAVGSPAADATMVLTNPDGRLRFPNDGDTTKTVTVPRSGAWVPFQISGETPSAAIGDAVIEAHCNTATGDIKGTKGVTVFWFDQAEIKITPGGTYTITGGRYTAASGNAVDYEAKARIRPAGIDCSAPQVTHVRIGIMQNALATITRQITWGSPSIVWVPGVTVGTVVTVPTQIRLTKRHPLVGNDTAASVAPLYDQPGKAETLDVNSLKPPGGCTSSGTATSHDTPSGPVTPTLRQPAQNAGGLVVGEVTYTFVNTVMTYDFRTWAVVFNTASNEFCALRERTWSLHADSASATPQQASAAAADAVASVDPVTSPTSNTIFNDPANHSTGPVGAATTSFTK